MVHSEEELKMLVTASQEAGVLEEQEEQMLHRVFDFADLTAGQMMVPRTELVAVEADTSGDDLLRAIAKAGYADDSGLPQRPGQRHRDAARDRRREGDCGRAARYQRGGRSRAKP